MRTDVALTRCMNNSSKKREILEDVYEDPDHHRDLPGHEHPDYRVLTGIETVEETLQAQEFPMDKNELAYVAGDIEVEDSDGDSVPVEMLLDEIEADQFTSVEDAVEAIREAARNFGRSAMAA